MVVLTPLTDAQIFLPVVGAVLVDVVNELLWLCVHNDSVEPDKAAHPIIVVTADEIPVFIAVPAITALD